MPRSRSPRLDDPALADRVVADVIGPGLRILFCGINPGLYSALTGHHFARPGNRFWPTLYAAGFTPRLLAPAEEQELLQYGYGITNMAERPSATAAELAPHELVAGGARLLEKARTYEPRVIAVLGITAYRAAFNRPKAVMGRQPEPIHRSEVWALPNPSGLNAHYTPTMLADVFREFRLAVG